MSEQQNQLIISVFNHAPTWLRRFLLRQFCGTDPALTDALLPLGIQDQEPAVRLTSLEVMAAYRRPQDLALLAQALDDVEMRIRAAAAYALGQYHTIQAGHLLLEARGDPQAEVRTVVAWALAQAPSLEFSEPLERLLEDPDSRVRAAAATSLGKVGRAQAAGLLEAMATRDPEEENREAARQAMLAIQKRHASPEEKRHQARVDLVAVLADPSHSPGERQRAKATLSRIGDEALIPDLDQALQASSDEEVRLDIVEVLAALPPGDQLQKTLISYLHQPPAVRRRAIAALSELGDEMAIFYLSDIARKGEQPGQHLTAEDAHLALEAIKKIAQRIR